MDAWIQAFTSKGGKARWNGVSAEERREVSAKGGNARAKAMTAAARSEAARKAVIARWAKKRKKKKPKL